jgi:hypothetical protein
MAVLQTGLAKSLAEDYTIDQSLRLDNAGADNDANYLVRLEDAWTSDGNQETWTISWWMKWDNEDSNSERWIYHVRGDKATSDVMGIDAILLDNEQLQYYCYTSAWSTLRCKIKTNRVFRDPSAWYHCMIVMDSTLASAADRTKFYVNGVRETSFATDTQIDQDQATNTNMNAETYVGASTSVTSTQSFGGYIAEFYRIDGQALGPDSFGETDTTTNQWKPIDASGLTFGTNGFYQKYAATELADSFTDSADHSIHTISIQGSVHTDTTTKKIGTASAEFDGTDDYLTISDASDFSFGTGDFTVECWWYRDAYNSRYLWDFSDGTSRITGHISNDGGGTIVNWFGTGWSNTTEDLDSGGLDIWNHLALVRDNGVGRWYVNGVQKNTLSSWTADFSGTWVSRIGARYTSNTADDNWDGFIDEFRVSSVCRYPNGTTFTDFGQGGGTVSSPTAFTADSSTKLLLHMDGSDSGTTFTDNSSTDAPRHYITAVGDVTNTRAEKKVGDSSIVFDNTGDYLSIPASPDWDLGTGDFTIETWIKVEGLTENGYIFDMRSGTGSPGLDAPSVYVDCDGSNDLALNFYAQGGTRILTANDTVTGAWQHMAAVRSSGTTTLYVGGVSKGTYSDSNDYDASGGSWEIGSRYNQLSTEFFDGYMDEFRISNVARYTTTFTPQTTEFTADSNTLLLIHSNWDGGLGADSSGNYNTFTATNLVATDKMLDSPTNNFCTLNPLVGEVGSGPRMSYQTMSEGNLKTICNTGTDAASVSSTFGFTDGKWYYEAFDDSTGSIAYDYPHVGIIDVASVGVAGRQAGQSNTLGVVYARDGDKIIDASHTSYGDTFTTSDVIGMAIDADNGAVYFSKNGVWQNSGDPESGASRTGAAYTYTGGTVELTPAFVVFDTDMGWVANFGQDSSFAGNVTAQGNQDGNSVGDFYYEPPSGYLALCTSNLPDPEIALPGDYFNTVLYTGDGADDHAITGVGFQPDNVWIKSRSVGDSHVIYDALRGATKFISPNNTNAEVTATDGLVSFDTDGFTLNDGAVQDQANRDTETYVSWNWLASNASAVTNDDGDRDSEVMANTTAGFSIVKYVGASGTSHTYGHGLSQELDLIIVKNRTYTTGWNVYNRPQGATKIIWLDSDGAEGTGAGYWNDVDPTDTVFTVGNSSQTGGHTNSDGYMAYCFHSVEGYSKVGGYSGNGNADGTFIYTGFRPSWLLVKRIDGAESWAIEDNKRSTYNVIDKVLFPDSNAVEQENSINNVDFISNGFKVRNSDSRWNNSSGEYLYLVPPLAKSPFKYANAR